MTTSDPKATIHHEPIGLLHHCFIAVTQGISFKIEREKSGCIANDHIFREWSQSSPK
jgi:hypothetical protein